MRNNKTSSQSLQKLFTKSVTRLQAGDIFHAKKGFIQLTRKLPDSAVVWYNLGLCHQHLGQHDKAITAYLKSLRIKPNQIDGWVNIGISYLELNQMGKAEEAILKSLELNPSHARGLNTLGTIQAKQDKLDDARTSFSKSIASQPDNRDARFNLVKLELKKGNYNEALSMVDSFLTTYPDDREALNTKAGILIDQKDYKLASPIVTALEADAPDDEQVMRLGLSYREAIRDDFGAIAMAQKLLKQFPKEGKLWNSLAMTYFKLGSVKKSRAYCEKAVALDPQNPELASNLGLIHSSSGDKENAELFYRKALQLDPLHAETLVNITAMKRFKSIDDPNAQQIISIWEKSKLDNSTRIMISFALGKIYDDCGRYDDAFKVYKIGNDLKFKESRIDLAAWFNHIDRISNVLNTPPMMTSQCNYSPQPIFILGMPRSGTTLVEQIISRHSQVHGCGELHCIEQAIRRLETKPDAMRVYPDDFRHVSQSEFEIEAREYLSWVKQQHDIKSEYLTDKMPFNFTHIWLIKAMFPDSVIVHCQRHPLDVIISNYFQLFGQDVGFTYNLESLTKYYIRYHQSMTKWKALFGDEIYNVVYEDLVSDVETQTRLLVGAANLTWEDNCLDQKRSDTVVRTASIWQVRQGIYTRSKERWKNYQAHLHQCIAILALAGILDSAGNWLERAQTGAGSCP